MCAFFLAALVSTMPAPEVLATGATPIEINHPLAGADLPTLAPPNPRAGAAASIGGFLSGGGAWFAMPYGGLSAGFNVSPFQDRFPDRAMSDVAKAGTLRPRVPLAAWGAYPFGGWRFGGSTVYGYLDDTSEIGGREFDRTRSTAFTAAMGTGRRVGTASRLDTSMSFTKLSASVLEGSFVEQPTASRLAFDALILGTARVDIPAGPGRLVGFGRGGGGKGKITGRKSSVSTASSGASWIGSFSAAGGVELVLGLAYEQWWGVVRRLGAELHQAARLPLQGPHYATISAHEGANAENGRSTSFSRALRLGYRFDRESYALHAVADVESFPSFVVVGAELAF